MRGFFVTGTDTGVGKTEVAAGLLTCLGAGGLRTLAMKPVASGCEETPEGLRNSDAEQLRACASVAVPYEVVNPYAFVPPIAPHVAAVEAGRIPHVADLAGAYRVLTMNHADAVVVEGAGGWRVPINSGETLADLARELMLPVVLVVGMRLGCLNHALLTAEAVCRDGLPLAGWVANHVDAEFARAEENLATLHAWMPAPCLGVVPRLAQPTPAAVADCLDGQALLQALAA